MNFNVHSSIATRPDEFHPFTSHMTLAPSDQPEWTAFLLWEMPELARIDRILLRWNDMGELEEFHASRPLEWGWPRQATTLLQANGIRVPRQVVRAH